jgi:ABC-type nitrate/sulfonate/bicarbonate transport system permease component
MAGLTMAVTLPQRRSALTVQKIGQIVLPWLAIAVLVAIWEMVAQSGRFTPYLLPAPSVVAARIYKDLASGKALFDIGMTLYRALVGFCIASVLGAVIGILTASLRPVKWFLDPLISIGFPVPKIAFLPIIILWFGLFDVSKIVMIVLDTIFPVIVATIGGVHGVDKHLIWTARNLGESERMVLWRVVLPAALPSILTGMQIGLPIALVVAIVTEMLTGGVGLGGTMLKASSFADSVGVYAGLVEIAIIGLALVKLMSHLRRRLLVWHSETDQNK